MNARVDLEKEMVCLTPTLSFGFDIPERREMCHIFALYVSLKRYFTPYVSRVWIHP